MPKNFFFTNSVTTLLGLFLLSCAQYHDDKNIEDLNKNTRSKLMYLLESKKDTDSEEDIKKIFNNKILNKKETKINSLPAIFSEFYERNNNKLSLAVVKADYIDAKGPKQQIEELSLKNYKECFFDESYLNSLDKKSFLVIKAEYNNYYQIFNITTGRSEIIVYVHEKSTCSNQGSNVKLVRFSKNILQ